MFTPITKQICCIIALLLLSFAATAQTCLPDNLYINEEAGLYPLPDTSGGIDTTRGINKIGIIGEYYEFTFTVVVPDSISFSGTQLDLDSLKIISVDNLPDGLNYSCNPPDCTVKDKSIGCILINGTPTVAGEDSIEITVDAGICNINSCTIRLVFPDPLIAEGAYILRINPPPSSSEDVLVPDFELFPNPNDGRFWVEAAGTTGKMELAVYSADGRLVAEQGVYNQGDEIELGGISPGIYFVKVQIEDEIFYRKIVVN